MRASAFLAGMLAVCGCGPAALHSGSSNASSTTEAHTAVSGDGGSVASVAPPAADKFQAGFHLALRWSESAPELDTFAMRLRVARSGSQVRATFRAGDGTLQLGRVFIGSADGGALVQLPVEAGASAQGHGYVSTGPANFAVHAGDELVVQFEAQGDLAASAIQLLPGSAYTWGAHADDPTVLTSGTAHPVPAGLAELDVLGPPTRDAIAIGDSITEGYVNGTDDLRNAWSSVASAQLGWPVVNAGVSGQGVWEEQQAVGDEVLQAQGITDCVVLLGTNDLGGDMSTELIEQRLQELWTTLAPFCTVHAVTLLPKENCTCDYDTVKAQRAAINAFIRASGPNVIDAEAAMRSAASPDQYAAGLTEDGIHPSVAGQKVLGQYIAGALGP